MKRSAVVTGVVLTTLVIGWAISAAQLQTPIPVSPRTIEVVDVEAERVKRLEDKAPDQAHAMTSVAYHFNNLWFAAQAENWPLAEFYLNETRSHLRWSVRIIPVRKDNAGKEVRLEDILQAIENSPLTQLREAIAETDRTGFEEAYRFTLEGCYACHKASDKPYLRPKIPETPAEPSIEFDPNAEWPK